MILLGSYCIRRVGVCLWRRNLDLVSGKGYAFLWFVAIAIAMQSIRHNFQALLTGKVAFLQQRPGDGFDFNGVGAQ